MIFRDNANNGKRNFRDCFFRVKSHSKYKIINFMAIKKLLEFCLNLNSLYECCVWAVPNNYLIKYFKGKTFLAINHSCNSEF